MKADRKKQPYLIRRRDGCPSIGQFRTGAGQPGAEINEHNGFVIITADSAGGMVDVHDRRPAVLAPELAREWLHPGMPIEQAEQMALNLGEPSDVFEWYRVSTAVGNVQNQGPDLIPSLN